MGNRVFSRFNIYDQFGYLFVGGVALLCIAFDLFLLKKLDSALATSLFSHQKFWVLLPLAYFTGHVVQALANIFISEGKTDFSDSQKEILGKAGKYFEVENQSLNEIWLLCYMISCARDKTGQIQAFNAYYGLYRGWAVVFGMNSFFMLYAVIHNCFSPQDILVLGISIILTWLMRRRSKRFYFYLRDKALQIFTLASKDKL